MTRGASAQTAVTPLPQRFHEQALASVGHSVVAVDLGGRVCYWNSDAEELYGYPAEEALGRPLIDLVVPADGRSIAQVRGEDLRAGATFSGDWRLRDKAGREFTVHIEVRPIRDDDGNVVGTLGVSRDVTNERKLTAALAASERRHRARFDDVPLAQAMTDLDGRFIEVNDAFCKLLGRGSADIIGRTSLHLHHPSDPFYGQHRAGSVFRDRQQSASWERIFARPDGTPVPVLMLSALIEDDEGNPDSMAVIMHDLTQLRAAQAEAALNTARFEALMRHAADWAIILDADHSIRYATPSIYAVLGWQPENVVGKPAWSFVHPDDTPHVAAALSRVEQAAGRTEDVVLRIRTAQDSWIWVEHALTNLTDDPLVGGIVINGRDVTKRIEAEQALRRSETRYRVMAETSRDALVLAGTDGRLVFANHRLAELTGRSMEDLYRLPLLQHLLPEQRFEIAQRIAARAERGAEIYDLDYLHPDGGHRILQVSVSPYDDGETRGSLSMISDVTATRQAEQEMRRRALHDDLTGLPNRTLLADRLEQALRRQRRLAGGSVAVLFTDLDQFKLVNDSLGHDAGDELLRQVAARLLDAVRPGDTVGRLGGDEFVVVCEAADEFAAQTIAQRISEKLEAPFAIGEQPVYVAASIGIAVAPPHTGDELMRFADAAMYDAKARGRGRVQVFDRIEGDHSADRLWLSNELRGALESSTLTMHYQPIVELATGQIRSVEALARWQHPDRGQVPPSQFISVAVETGLAHQVDRWALTTAVRNAELLRALLGPGGRIAVNVTGGAFDDERLEELLGKLDMPRDLLTLEVTESVLVERPDNAREVMSRLRERGIQTAIDDFGTGFSSLAYLNQLPVQALKIDRGFVENITTDGEAYVITAAVIDLGRALGMHTIAEGVETPEQYAVLRRLGCWGGQGYLWSPALPLQALQELVDGLPEGRFPPLDAVPKPRAAHNEAASGMIAPCDSDWRQAHSS